MKINNIPHTSKSVKNELFDLSSIAYYEDNSDLYIVETQEADMGGLYKPFLQKVPQGGRILDLGCGSGRDSKFFAELSYSVVALDASSKMVTATKNLVKAEVYQMRFDEMNFIEEFDGIWACASLLHVPEQGLKDIIYKCHHALKANGVMYLTFKYGISERVVGERIFTDFDEIKLRSLLSAVGFELVNQWVTPSVILNKPDEKWLNAIIQKT